MATDAISLNNQGLMYAGQSPPQWQLMKLSLLAQILLNLNPMAAVDANSLLTAAQGYCTFGPQAWQLMELALLAQLAGGGFNAGNGAQCGNFGGAAPNFIPQTGCGIAVDTSNGRIWWYYNGQWN